VGDDGVCWVHDPAVHHVCAAWGGGVERVAMGELDCCGVFCEFCDYVDMDVVANKDRSFTTSTAPSSRLYS
jgi:hypothetical protein